MDSRLNRSEENKKLFTTINNYPISRISINIDQSLYEDLKSTIANDSFIFDDNFICNYLNNNKTI